MSSVTNVPNTSLYSLYQKLGIALNKTDQQEILGVLDEMRKTIQKTSQQEEPSESFSEQPMITFNTQGKILDHNPTASALLKNSLHIQDLLFTPNYFLEITQRALVVEQKKELLWKVDLQFASQSCVPAKVKVTSQDSFFQAKIRINTEKTPQENPYSLQDACVIRYSSEWKILYSEGAQRILGFTDSELCDKNGLELMHQEDVSSLTKESSGSIVRHAHKDLSYVWVRISSNRLNDGNLQCLLHKFKIQKQSQQENLPLKRSLNIVPEQENSDKYDLDVADSGTHSSRKSSRKYSPLMHPKNDSNDSVEIRGAKTHISSPQQINIPTYSVLVIEDNPTNQSVMRQMLGRLHQQVQIFSNGQEALDYLNQAKTLPDLIITDKEMPVMDGMEFLKAIRANTKLQDLYCMMWTDNPTSSLESDYQPLKIAQFLDKVITFSALTKALLNFAETHPPSTID